MCPIEVETGPMFSGKSDRIVEACKRQVIGGHVHGRHFLTFTHHIDTRFDNHQITSRKGGSCPAVPISSSKEILNEIFDKVHLNNKEELVLKEIFQELRAIYIDEAQFFDDDLPDVLNFINEYFETRFQNRKIPIEIIAAGLDMDFRGEPFGPMATLMTKANKVNKHVAVCSKCGEDNATRTQRLIDGNPANHNDPIILVGNSEAYTARCIHDHEVPGKNLLE